MKEGDFRIELLLRRDRLLRDKKKIEAQLKACETMLAAPTEMPPESSPGLAPETTGTTMSGGQPQAVPNAATTSTANDAVPPPSAPPAAPVERLGPTAAELEELAELANGRRRGAFTAKVELAIADCGDTFSLRTIAEVFKTKFGMSSRFVTDKIGSALWKVARVRRYRVVSPGAGTSPTLYSKLRKPPSQSP